MKGRPERSPAFGGPFASKLSTIHATKAYEAPAPVVWAIGAVHVATLLWQRRQCHRQGAKDSTDCQDSDSSIETCCEVHTVAPVAGSNPYRAAIDKLLARGSELVTEVNGVPSEDRQDAIADELNDIAKQIHKLLEQETAYLKGQNS